MMFTEPLVGDAFGRVLRRCWEAGALPGVAFEIIERDDGHVGVGDAARYFDGPDRWSPAERWGCGQVAGRVLDVGCGAGLYPLSSVAWRPRTLAQLAVVRQHTRAAIGLLDWLSTQNLMLATCRQADLDRWLSRSDARNRQEAGHFVRWAAKQRLTKLTFPAIRWQGPSQPLDDQARWDTARRLLHDNTLNTRDRLAGLLVLLYAQKTTTISRLTTSHIDTTDSRTQLRLGSAPITLPDPLADLCRQVMAEHRGHATTGANAPSPWLFPGGQPGRPINAGHLGIRLKALGIHPGQARSTALFQLATELPAAVLARMLGIHIDVAVAWQKHSSGDWTNYAADVSRRADEQPRHRQPANMTEGATR